MTSFTVNMCQQWEDRTILDIHKEMINLTSAIISKAVLGSNVKSQQADEVGDALLTCAEYFNRLLMPFGEQGFSSCKRQARFHSIRYD